MELKVLGPGCAKCNKLYEEARKAIEESGVQATLTMVESLTEIADLGVMITPAFIIDGRLKASGNVPKAAKIARWLEEMAR